MNEGYGWNTVWLLLVMIAVIVAAYYTTKLLAKRTGRMTRGGRYINVLDRMNVARDKQIALVEVAGKVMLIGISNQSINVLETFDAEDIEAESETVAESPGKGVLGKVTGFFSNAKKADANLRKARAQYRQEKQTQKKTTPSDDFLTKMNEAIEQRKRREMGEDEDEQ